MDDALSLLFLMAAATLRVALRRIDAPKLSTREHLAVGDLVIDHARNRVFRKGEEIRLTPKELALLVLLAQHAGRVLTHRTILKAIWGPGLADQPEHLPGADDERQVGDSTADRSLRPA